MQLGLAGPLSIGGSGKSPKVEDFSLIGTITELNVEYKFARGESLRKKNDARRSNEKGKGKGGAKGGQVSSQVGKGVSSQVLDPTTGLTMEDGTGMGDDRLGATWKADSAENASVASPSGGLRRRTRLRALDWATTRPSLTSPRGRSARSFGWAGAHWPAEGG